MDRRRVAKKMALTLGALLMISAPYLFTLSAARAQFGSGSFREQFMELQSRNRFDALVFLVKQNKKIIPGEVSALVKEAMGGEKTYDEKIELLGLAQSMASMHKEWHGDGKPLEEVEPVLSEVIRKEQERLAEIEKWTKYEKFTGNILMRTHRSEMDSKNVAPVIFPHWVHRMWYDCKACHPDVFAMKRETITHAKMTGGGQCGRCHDGSTAFSPKEKCEKCHIAGMPGEERLMSAGKVDLEQYKAVAARLGSGLNVSKLPLDRFGSPDWAELWKTNAYLPLKSLDKTSREETRDNVILFELRMPGIKSVLFNHRTHSSGIKCSSCHQEIFKDKLGANTVNMTEMVAGRACAFCHGKVAFKSADCNRCHERPQGEPAGGLLIRK